MVTPLPNMKVPNLAARLHESGVGKKDKNFFGATQLGRGKGEKKLFFGKKKID